MTTLIKYKIQLDMLTKYITLKVMFPNMPGFK